MHRCNTPIFLGFSCPWEECDPPVASRRAGPVRPHTNKLLHLSLLVLLTSAVACGGDGDDSGQNTDGLVCGASPISGRHLWNVGNCETGAVTPLDEPGCRFTLCGANARESSECAGDKLFDVDVDGSRAEISRDGVILERVRYERELDCSAEPAATRARCEKFKCQLAVRDDLYVQRFVDRDPSEQIYADGLHMVRTGPGRRRTRAARIPRSKRSGQSSTPPARECQGAHS